MTMDIHNTHVYKLLLHTVVCESTYSSLLIRPSLWPLSSLSRPSLSSTRIQYPGFALVEGLTTTASVRSAARVLWVASSLIWERRGEIVPYNAATHLGLNLAAPFVGKIILLNIVN